jgi:hypothetical protein
LRLLGPQSGLIATGEKSQLGKNRNWGKIATGEKSQLGKSKSNYIGGTRLAISFTKTNATAGWGLPELSKFDRLPGRAGGTPSSNLAKALRADLSQRLDWGIWVLVRP